ncbi:hypothetical protein JCM30237_27510 [Halolamina litorea]|uniref:Uncharacterized protein n=1 Tax=Halolamina litorea TaxID=1515593 RepID=A0ABD6BNQ4_9EURY|nr:hypothetical protein [Halolamina litorea]
MSGPRPSIRAAVAVLAGSTVVGAELAALTLSTRLSVATLEGTIPTTLSALPVVAVSAAAVGLVVGVRRHEADGVWFVGSGVGLIVAAPVTAFGGGCAFVHEGVGLFRSGVRIGIAVEQCVTFLNGALLVLGYGLLVGGLWLGSEDLPVPSVATRRSPEPSE